MKSIYLNFVFALATLSIVQPVFSKSTDSQRKLYLEQVIPLILEAQNNQFVLVPSSIRLESQVHTNQVMLLSTVLELAHYGWQEDFKVSFLVRNPSGQVFSSNRLSLVASSFSWLMNEGQSGSRVLAQKTADETDGKEFYFFLDYRLYSGSIPRELSDIDLGLEPGTP